MSRLDNFSPQRGVIADFNLNPTLGSETGKIRPCVVVSNNIYNQKLSVIQIVPITVWSAKKARIITNIVLNPSSQNGLSKKSKVHDEYRFKTACQMSLTQYIWKTYRSTEKWSRVERSN